MANVEVLHECSYLPLTSSQIPHSFVVPQSKTQRQMATPKESSRRKREKKPVPKQKCCVDSFDVPTARSGNQVIRRRRGRRKAGEAFAMQSDFNDAPPPCKCKCCEYRQYVRGYFKYDGRKLRHMLPSGQMSETVWKEDGITNPPPGPHFGHRDEVGAADDRYLPGRADGCKYRGTDFPGLTGSPGKRFEIKLEFKGEIIDVCNGHKVVKTTTWKVKFSGRLSRRRKYWD